MAALKAGESVNLVDMVFGNTGGTIGETSAIAILIGACILLITGIIDLRIPASYLVTFVLFVGLFGGNGFDPAYLTAANRERLNAYHRQVREVITPYLTGEEAEWLAEATRPV